MNQLDSNVFPGLWLLFTSRYEANSPSEEER